MAAEAEVPVRDEDRGGIEPESRLVHHLVERVARTAPERVFIVGDEDAHSYAAIDAHANQIARLLVRHGLEVGDRVGLLSENSAFHVACYYGVLKAGGIVVPLNTAARDEQLSVCLARCGARCLIVGPRHLRAAARALARGGPVELALVPNAGMASRIPHSVRAVGLETAASESAAAPGIEIDPSAPAAIIYTSGSTGVPQGATLSHRNILANARSIVSYLALGAEDRVLCILPFYYVYGLSLLNTHAMAGGSLVIENRFAFPNTALDSLADKRCTGLSGVPSTFAILLNRSNFAERSFPALRYVTQAGGAMSPDLTSRLLAALDGPRLFVMYGATEASARLAYLHPDALPEKLGSIGRAIPGVTLRILDADGQELGPHERGEIVAQGDNIMLGYWGDSEATAEVLDAAGYHTGDVAYRDEDGFLFIVGRQKDFIKAGAHRVAAREIEDAIATAHPVHEVAVIGAPDPILGERIVAYVVPRLDEALDAEALAKALKRVLPAYKLPSEIHLRDDLPKNESGKIMKQPLKDAWHPEAPAPVPGAERAAPRDD